MEMKRICGELFPFYYDINPIVLGVFITFVIVPLLLKKTITSKERQQTIRSFTYYGAFIFIWIILDNYIANGKTLRLTLSCF